MAKSDIEVIRAQFEAVNERDFGRAMDLYADGVVLVVPRAEGVHSPGTYVGKKAVGDWFGDWFRTFDRDYRFEIQEAEDLGDVVFLWATHRGRGRLSGAAVHGENAYLYTVRGGRIARVEFYASREEALAVVGRRGGGDGTG